jgi:hypothetical protein
MRCLIRTAVALSRHDDTGEPYRAVNRPDVDDSVEKRDDGSSQFMSASGPKSSTGNTE